MIPSTTRFLILDDISAIRGMLKQNLKDIGISTTPIEAENVAKAIELIQKSLEGGDHKVDFILSDWNLPDDIGLNFLKKVRANHAFDHIPFVMVTTENEISHMLDAVNAGCNNYVVKPWTVDDLKEKVNNAWDMMQKALKAKASAPPPTEAQLAAKAKSEAAAVAASEAAQKEKLTPKASSQKPSIRKQAAPIKKKPIGNAKAAEKSADEKNKKKSFWEKLFG